MCPIQIDPDRCVRDDLCALHCPLGIIKPSRAKEPPTVSPSAASHCVRCGHCVAICPTGAISIDPGAHPLAPAGAIPSFDQVAMLLRTRRSTRLFQKEAVAQERLQSVFDIARYAPSGHNRQPTQWLVVSDPSHIRELAEQTIAWMRLLIEQSPDTAREMHLEGVARAWMVGKDLVLRNAPHLVIAHAPSGERTAPAAAHIALATFEIAAHAAGLGTCWAGYFQRAALAFEPLGALLALPSGHQSYGALMVGIPVHRFRRIPERKPARVTWR